MKNSKATTVCAYCGVGCGIHMIRGANGGYSVESNNTHPANKGFICHKGKNLGETVYSNNRLTEPSYRIPGSDSWRQLTPSMAVENIATELMTTIQKHGPDSVGFYGSGQLLTEDYYIANKFMKGYIGSANIDTNSRLCMASAVTAHKLAFGQDSVSACYDDLELADLTLLIGSNTASCHPVIDQRIRASQRLNDQKKVVVIDPRKTRTVQPSDLHLDIRPGTDIPLFLGLLRAIAHSSCLNQNYINNHTQGFADTLKESASMTIAKVAEICGLSPAKVSLFYKLFIETPKTLSLFSQGINQSLEGTHNVLSIINCHLATGRLGQPGSGILSLTGQGNAMGGREVGGLANQLASHLDINNQLHRQALQDFWQSPSMIEKPGLKAVDIFKAMAKGDIKAVIIMATNPMVSLPDTKMVRQALEACPLVIVAESHGPTDTSEASHYLLPSYGWGEKDGMVTNSERCLSRQRAFLKPPVNCREDWRWLCLIAQKMGFDGFNFQSPYEIFREYVKLSKMAIKYGSDLDLTGLDQLTEHDYNQFQPRQWPINRSFPKGRKRLFDDGQFYTASGLAQILPTPYKPKPPLDYCLNTGRNKDQWHTMTRTGLSPALNRENKGPYVEIHPRDREALVPLYPASGLCRISNDQGSMTARIVETTSVRRGMVFVPFHWSQQFGNELPLNQLTSSEADLLSGQPGFKHTEVRVQGYSPDIFGVMLTRGQAPVHLWDYWSRVDKNGFERYDFAVTHWESSLLSYARYHSLPRGKELIESRGPGFLFQCHVDQEGIFSCLYLSSSSPLPSTKLIEELMTAAKPLTLSLRYAVVCQDTANSQPTDRGVYESAY